MAKRQKKTGKYSRVSKERQHANKVARDRRYRANQRQRAEQAAAPKAYKHDGDGGPSLPVGLQTAAPSLVTHDRPADKVDAAAKTEPEGGAPVATPPPGNAGGCNDQV